jgi:DNA polymerase III epsilon subunit-like protein
LGRRDRITKSDAIKSAQSAVALQPVYLDTETTGMDPVDQVIEICVLDFDGAVLVESLVRPTRPISPGARRVHGIGDSIVRGAPSWAELWPRVCEVLSGRQVAIYNADFDLRLMRQSHRAHGLEWRPADVQSVCVMELYARYNGLWDARRRSFRWVSLEDAGQQCGIRLPNAHRAKADAMLARAILEYMARN